MRLFTASLGTETNSFSPFPTGIEGFKETGIYHNGNYNKEEPFFFFLPAAIWSRRGKEKGWEVIESLAAFAQPAGITLSRVYETFRDEILENLKNALPVDLVLLNLHGAMISQGYPDCEGDLLKFIRGIVGPDVPVGVELDLHCHLTEAMLANANVIITYKEYPHTDIPERGEDLFRIMSAVAEGRCDPRMTFFDCEMSGIFHTSREPMSSLLEEIREMEKRSDVLSVSICHGFPWGDVSDMGTKIIVITDGYRDADEVLAKQIGERLFSLRESLAPDYKTIDEALDLALALPDGPVVLADVSDNAGGGAANDSTFILERMFERNITNAAVGCIWDPMAAALAFDAGEGTSLTMRVGGKTGPMSGNPLDLNVTVTKVMSEAFQTAFGLSTVSMGKTAALHCKGVDIVVNTKRTQTFSPEVFLNLGINPEKRKILVVKSMQHFYSGFYPISANIIYVAAPGSTSPDFGSFSYKHVNPLKLANGKAFA